MPRIVNVATISFATLEDFAPPFNLRHPDTKLRFVHAYDAEPELRWNLAVGLRRADPPLREAIDAALDKLAADGTVARIYARYGIEYRPPVAGGR